MMDWLLGSGLASVFYENRFGDGLRLGGYQIAMSGVAATPEPASLLLVSSGVLWVVGRHRARVST